MKKSMMFLAALAALFALTSFSAFAQDMELSRTARTVQRFSIHREQPEAARERDVRLDVNRRHEALAMAMATQARANAVQSTANANAARSTANDAGITITCSEPLQVVDWGVNEIVTLCDPLGTGQALFRGMFYKSPDSAFTSLVPYNNRLYGMDNSGTLSVFTDTLSRGIADYSVQQYPGLAYSDRILPTGNIVYSEDNRRGRLYQYNLHNGGATSQAGNLPWLGGGNIHGTTLAGNTVYTIDGGQNVVLYKNLGETETNPHPLLWGYRITTIAVDQATEVIFAQSAGNCHDIQPPSVGGLDGQTAGSVQACQPPSIAMLYRDPFSGDNKLAVAPDDPLLDVFYSYQNSMYASNGKLYVVSLVRSNDGSWKQRILLYRYKITRDGPVISRPTVFAGPEMFSEWPFLTSLTSFSGGPVATIAQQ